MALKSLGNLKLSRADLTDEASLNGPIAGGDTVFHVATPINFASEDPEVYDAIMIITMALSHFHDFKLTGIYLFFYADSYDKTSN